MDLFAAEIGMDRGPPTQLHPPDQFLYDNPSGLGTASGGAKIYIDSATTSRRWTRPSRPSTTRSRRTEGGRAGAEVARRRSEHLHRGVRRGPVEMDRGGRRGLGRRDVGVGEHPRPPDRQDGRHDGHPTAGPGPRDDVCPGGRRSVSASRWRHRRPALGYTGHAVRLWLVRLRTSPSG